MKAIFIACNQAHYERLIEEMTHTNLRGFTSWRGITGRGSDKGDPHYGNPAWPTLNDAILTFVEDDKVARFLEFLRKLDEKTPELGIRAFVWKIEEMM